VGRSSEAEDDEVLRASPPSITWDKSPRVHGVRVLEVPRSMNPSRSRIYQPRRPNTGECASSHNSPMLLTS